MSSALINGRRLQYRLSGGGVPVVLTPGGRLGMDAVRSTAVGLAEECRLLEWDRSNTGASDVYLGELSEQLQWADDLVALLEHLELGPAYLTGGSAGSRVSYLAAIRHPGSVRGLVLWSVSGGPYASQLLGYQYHPPFINAAILGGMPAVIETQHYRELVEANPANRDRLLALDPEQFITMMRHWNELFFARDDMPAIGATADELRTIRCPTLLFDGNDDFHPTETAHTLHELIAGSELVPCAWSRDEWMWRFVGRIPESPVELYPPMIPTIVEFIRRCEGTAGAAR